MRNHNQRWEKGLYRSRRGLFFGVCKGLAEHLEFPVFWMRVIWIAVALFTVALPVIIAYFIAAILMKPEPVVPFESEADREFYDSYVSSRSMGIRRLKRSYDNLDSRIQRIESIVTEHNEIILKLFEGMRFDKQKLEPLLTEGIKFHPLHHEQKNPFWKADQVTLAIHLLGQHTSGMEVAENYVPA